MKKILSIITIIALGLQMIATRVSAAPVYDDWFHNGNVVFANMVIPVATSTSLASVSGGNYATFTENVPNLFTLIDPSGNLVGVTFDFGTNMTVINCITPANNYGQTGTGVACDYDDTIVDSDYVINPLNPLIQTANTTALDGAATIDGAFDSHGDLWLAFSYDIDTISGNFFDGQYVARLTFDSNYQTVYAYDVNMGTDSGNCSNITYTTKATCEGAAEDWYDTAPFAIGINRFGDVWVTSLGAGSTMNNKVICLDRQEDFAPCAGAGFDSYGRVTVGSEPHDLVIDSNDNVFVSSLNASNGVIYKVDSVTGSTVSRFVSTLDATLGSIWYVTLDEDENIWVAGEDDGSGTVTRVACFTNNAAMSSLCATSIQVPKINTSLAGNLSFDGRKGCSNNLYTTESTCTDNGGTWRYEPRLWVYYYDTTAPRLYCYDSDNSFAACSDVTGGYLTASVNTDNQLNMGDPTGSNIVRLMNAVAGQDQVNVSGVVDPTISLSIRTPDDSGTTNACAMGNITSGGTGSCAYGIAVSTNASGGFVTYIQSNGPLTDGVNNIADVTNDQTIDAGTEEYGIAVTGLTGGTEQGTFTADYSPIPTAQTALVSYPSPFAHTPGGVTTDITVVTHGLGTSNVTPAGSYTQTVTYTVVGTF